VGARVYDAVVIGAGIGGLTAGALLAKRGLDVLVLEHHTAPGGSASCFERKGYRFDVGASLFYGLARTGTTCFLSKVFDEIGERLDIVHDPIQIHYHLPNGREVRAHYDRERFLEELIAVFPHEARGIRRFYDRIDAFFRRLNQMPFESIEDLGHLVNVARAFPLGTLQLMYYSLVNVAKIARRYVRDRELLDFIELECYSWALTDASAVPFINGAIVLGDRHYGGIHYPLGGSQAIAETLVRGLERHGGEVRFRARVEEILVEGGAAAGVRLANGEEIRARRVVSNATYGGTFGGLLRSQPEACAKALRRIAPFAQGPSFFSLFAGVRADAVPRAFSAHHIVIEDFKRMREEAGTIFVSIPSIHDPSLAPDGRRVLHCFASHRKHLWPERGKAYKALKRELADSILERLEAIMPGLRDAVEHLEVATPRTNERYLARPGGSYGLLLRRGRDLMRKPQNSTPLPNLYCVGDSCFPGQGVTAVAASGAACARLIDLEDRPKQRQVTRPQSVPTRVGDARGSEAD
jgi:prolycopene isomerase